MIRYVIPSVERKRVVWHFLMAAVVLTAYGQSPGDLEFTLFVDERGLGKSSVQDSVSQHRE